MVIYYLYQLIIMSIVSSGLYLVMKLLSMFTMKYFSAAWHYYTYFIVFTFFFIPYYRYLSRIELKFSEWISVGLKKDTGEGMNPFNLISPKADVTPIIQKKNIVILTAIIEYIPYILIAGTIIFMAVIFVKNYKTNRNIRKMCKVVDDIQILKVLSHCRKEIGVKKEIPIYISACMTTPFLYGIFKPHIVLPVIELTEEELRCALLHELTHYKRHDLWIKYLMVMINAIHWFNPLAYVMRRNIDRFCELSCDESVVISMNTNERRRYCELILSVLSNITNNNNNLFAFSNERKNLESRITMIMKNDISKNKKWARTLAVAMTFTLVLGGAITANAASEKSGYKTKISVTSTAGENISDSAKVVKSQREEDGYKTKTTATTSAASDVFIKLSFGEGTLHTNSSTGNAYSSTETFSGDAEYIYVYVGAGNNLKVKDSDSNYKDNDDYVETSEVDEASSNSRFAKSNHEITYSGETQTASNTDNY